MARLRKKPGKKSVKKQVAGTAALLLGAAGLALFIMGAKRRHRLDAEREVGYDDGPRGGGRAAAPEEGAREE